MNSNHNNFDINFNNNKFNNNNFISLLVILFVGFLMLLFIIFWIFTLNSTNNSKNTNKQINKNTDYSIAPTTNNFEITNDNPIVIETGNNDNSKQNNTFSGNNLANPQNSNIPSIFPTISKLPTNSSETEKSTKKITPTPSNQNINQINISGTFKGTYYYTNATPEEQATTHRPVDFSINIKQNGSTISGTISENSPITGYATSRFTGTITNLSVKFTKTYERDNFSVDYYGTIDLNTRTLKGQWYNDWSGTFIIRDIPSKLN